MVLSLQPLSYRALAWADRPKAIAGQGAPRCPAPPNPPRQLRAAPESGRDIELRDATAACAAGLSAQGGPLVDDRRPVAFFGQATRPPAREGGRDIHLPA